MCKAIMVIVLLYSNASLSEVVITEKYKYYIVDTKAKNELLNELTRQSKKYDKQTNHGETQGAWLNKYL